MVAEERVPYTMEWQPNSGNVNEPSALDMDLMSLTHVSAVSSCTAPKINDFLAPFLNVFQRNVLFFDVLTYNSTILLLEKWHTDT